MARTGAANRTRSAIRIGAALGATLLAMGCAYRGDIDSPATQKATWYSYLDGADIRAACAAGAPDTYRLVYNGRYEEQLRSYEVTADGNGADLLSRAQGAATLTELQLDDPMAPWRWQKSETRLTSAELQAFRDSLAEGGFYAGAPRGLWLYSHEFYWVAAGCTAGRFDFSAWAHPSDGFSRLTFPAFLIARDRTGLAYNAPRAVDPGERLGPRGGWQNSSGVRFRLQVDEDGIAGAGRLF